jgi:predicted nuclease with TOPRIM domain
MQEILQDKIGFKVKLEEQRDKLEMLVVENATLKEKIQALEDDCKRAKN